jgi:serine/threonine-protein kinase
MGAVYRALRLQTGETVALKVIKGDYAADEQFARRFNHEARAASQVQHKHLVPVVDVGEVDGRPYIAMRYIAGPTLEQRIREAGPLPIRDVVRIAAQIGSGIDALHAHGIVHRDIKPANILICEGSACLTDFGVAKGRGFSKLTKTGGIVGTLNYLAPERLQGQPATPQSDIYALGCVVYEALAGKPPFSGKSMFEIGMAVLDAHPGDPCAERDDAPPSLTKAALLALAEDPAARPPTAKTYVNLLAVAARSALR